MSTQFCFARKNKELIQSYTHTVELNFKRVSIYCTSFVLVTSLQVRGPHKRIRLLNSISLYRNTIGNQSIHNVLPVNLKATNFLM